MSAPVQLPGGARPDQSMSLLTSMFERPLDPAYAAAAEAREAAGLPRSTSFTSPLIVSFFVVLGLVLGLVSASLRGTETTRSKARAALVERIQTSQETVAEQDRTVAGLQAEVARLEEQQLAPGDRGETARLRTLAVAAGSVSLTGPGVVVTLDDAPSAQERAASGGSRIDPAAEDYVLSRDLQFVVNSLWESGAEAIAVNNQRLTTTSAIRFAGEAILVDFRPLNRPYVVTALGAPDTLAARFKTGVGGIYLSTLTSSFGLVTDQRAEDHLSVPASPTLTLRYAVPASPNPSGGTP